MSSPEQRALDQIARCADAGQLRAFAKNAHRQGAENVRRAAQLRLYEILPASQPGTLEHDVWQSIYALEDQLKEERGKTVLLSRTRQKIARDGEVRTVADLVMGKQSEGYRMLVDRNMIDLTFEAVALRHPDRFEQHVLEAAKTRLS